MNATIDATVADDATGAAGATDTADGILWPDAGMSVDVAGGKAATLAKLGAFRVPAWFAVPANTMPEGAAVLRALERLRGERFAVRSSAHLEDGATASYAGQFESYLFVSREEVFARVLDVRASAESQRLSSYRSELGSQRAGAADSACDVPCAIVQTMVDAEVAGVAFTRDPVNGTRATVVSATYGLGPGVVSGDCATDTYRIAADGRVSDRAIVAKTTAHRAGAAAGTQIADVAPERARVAALDDRRLREVAALAARVEQQLGYPVDIEWAYEGNTLYLLQARPITAYRAPVIWDNANISESYGGVTSPLTYSFARYAYEGAYRHMLRMLGVSPARIAANDAVLANLVGLVRGRIYYNLLNWYRLLALVPGFTLNRGLMETMMGVSEALPADVADDLARASAGAKLRDARDAVLTLASLARAYAFLPRDVRRFEAHVRAVLDQDAVFDERGPTGLVDEFRRLERELLSRWETPLVNDFFTMIAYGVLRKLARAWCGDTDGTLQNGLLCAEGGMLSAEPATLVCDLAREARHDGELVRVLCAGDQAAIEATLPAALAAQIASYLARFGDRSDGELKLETRTLRDDPLALYRAIGRVASSEAAPDAGGVSGLPRTGASIVSGGDVADAGVAFATDRSGAGESARREAEFVVAAALREKPVRRAFFDFVLRSARVRIRDRERLRFLRTLLFARVRQIFRSIGERLVERGVLDDARDVFWLTLDEVLGYVEGTAPGRALRALAAARRDEFAAYRAGGAPPDRFEVRDPRDFETLRATPSLAGADRDGAACERRDGIGCCPGIVTARVRVVHDPHARFAAGEILVAERTDPGWVILFPAAAGILVERGSLLSHAAIVSREMGVPSIVGIAGLTQWLHDGDLIRFDGRTGTVDVLERAAA